MKHADSMRTAFQTLSEIAIIGQLADAALRQVLPAELSVASFGVLNHFARLGVEGESPTRLARAFQVTKGAMTYTLQQLEELKYVKIEADPADARAKIVRLTKAGARAREDAIRRVDPGMRALIEALGAGAFADALPFLVKLRQVLDAARD
jgi:DNA-binding MarR family transcriptional regulator